MDRRDEPLDSAELRLRLRTVVAGVWLTYFGGAGFAVYFLLTWDRPHRVLGLGVLCASIAASVVLMQLPVERLMHHPRRREAFFVGWSASIIALVTFVMFVDGGGADSPLSAALFYPVTFAAVSYPTKSVAAVGVLAVTTYVLAAAIGGGVELSEAFIKTWALTGVAGIAGWLARNHAEHRAELDRASRTDALTGSLNRRGFEERLEGQLAQAARSAHPLALVLVDLDSFKQVNDSRGHAAGDGVLCETVRALQAVVRPGDAVGRLGGDEFAVLLPDTGRDGGRAVVAKLRARMDGVCRASFGIASFPVDGDTAEGLHHHADAELYAAKRSTVADTPRELSWAAALAAAVDHRMGSEHEHSRTVSEYAVAIADRLGLEDVRIAPLRMAAILHDIGKVAIPDAILQKPGPLTPEEVAIMRTHSPAGEQMVRRIDGLEAVARHIRHSHEHVDGTGYPDGLVGDEIPLESRILLVADAFDAMTSDRAYRRAVPAPEAIAELRRCAGSQFDPALVELLAAHMGSAAGGPLRRCGAAGAAERAAAR